VVSTAPFAFSGRGTNPFRPRALRGIGPNRTLVLVDSRRLGIGSRYTFEPETGPFAGTPYSVLGTSFVPLDSVLTTPPASFNSQPYIYMTREDGRYNSAFLGQLAVTDYFQPYAEV
jgi:hypothetical protein